jgi:hypothetical protein
LVGYTETEVEGFSDTSSVLTLCSAEHSINDKSVC